MQKTLVLLKGHFSSPLLLARGSGLSVLSSNTQPCTSIFMRTFISTMQLLMVQLIELN